MAHTKAQKAVRGNRDSKSKRLGVKKYGNQAVAKGNVILRQRGTKVRPGPGTFIGRDHTIMASRSGKVKFYLKKSKQYITIV